MSQSVTLYQGSQNNFKQLEISKELIQFDTSCAKFNLKLDQAAIGNSVFRRNIGGF